MTPIRVYWTQGTVLILLTISSVVTIWLKIYHLVIDWTARIIWQPAQHQRGMCSYNSRLYCLIVSICISLTLYRQYWPILAGELCWLSLSMFDPYNGPGPGSGLEWKYEMRVWWLVCQVCTLTSHTHSTCSFYSHNRSDQSGTALTSSELQLPGTPDTRQGGQPIKQSTPLFISLRILLPTRKWHKDNKISSLSKLIEKKSFRSPFLDMTVQYILLRALLSDMRHLIKALNSIYKFSRSANWLSEIEYLNHLLKQ